MNNERTVFEFKLILFWVLVDAEACSIQSNGDVRREKMDFGESIEREGLH